MTASGGPVFIGGPHRSGTGMIRAILGSNSRLALPPKEYQYFDRLAPTASGALDPAATLATVLQWPKVREWGVSLDLPNLLASLGPASPGAVYAAPLRAYAAARGKPRWGEKTPFLERHFETLLDWFGPGIRFVHILRQPLATYTSLCHQGGARHVLDPIAFARRWHASAARGADYARRFQDQYLLIPYEGFVRDPEPWVERLCAFCDLPREIDAMLAMRDFTRKRNSSFGVDTDEADSAVGHQIVADAEVRHPRMPLFDAWLIRRELAILRRQTGGPHPRAFPDEHRSGQIWLVRGSAAFNRLAMTQRAIWRSA